MFKKLIAAAIFSSVSMMAVAQDAVDISGDVAVVGMSGDNVAVAVGTDNTAENNVGAIGEGVSIDGDATVVGIVVGTNTAIAEGEGNCAKNNVGTVGVAECE